MHLLQTSQRNTSMVPVTRSRNVRRLSSIFILLTLLMTSLTNYVAEAGETQESKPVRLASAADWILMKKEAKVKAPSPRAIRKAVEDCRRINQPLDATFWLCMATKVGLTAFKDNFQYIICSVYQITKVQPDLCVGCYPQFDGPCDNECPAAMTCQACCDIERLKCHATGTGAAACQNEHTQCYANCNF